MEDSEILLQLRRKYSNDETIKLAIQELVNRDIEIGKLKSHIAKLEYKNFGL